MKKVQDIEKDTQKRLNISYKKYIRIPIKKIIQYSLLGGIIVSFFTGLVQAPQSTFVRAQEDQSLQLKQSEREELERQLKEYEQQIAETQKTIDTYRKAGNSLKGEISTLNAKITKLNLQIKSINLNLSKLNQEISETQKEINHTENKIDTHKEVLAQGLQTVYESENENLLTILLSHNDLSDFFDKLNNLQLVQNNLRISLENITKLRQGLLDQKQELSLQKEDAENLKKIQDSQKKDIQLTQTQKNNLLKTTQGKESEYKKVLAKTQETAAKIRARLFELLGGGQLTFQKALDYARIAEKVTGVRASLILGVLDRESRFGANTGRCVYNAINPTSGKTNMNPKEIPIFEAITSALGIDPISTFARISCPNADGTYGGAMGPAQFIPSTWKAFESRIAQATGNRPPSPWNNSDAFVATGLYLKEFGAGTRNSTDEKKAAAIYYCGTNWKRYSCNYYASRVMENASKFEKDIELLDSTN